jgi:hypothetical protein
MDAVMQRLSTLGPTYIEYDTRPNFLGLVIFCMYSSTGHLLKELEIAV